MRDTIGAILETLLIFVNPTADLREFFRELGPNSRDDLQAMIAASFLLGVLPAGGGFYYAILRSQLDSGQINRDFFKLIVIWGCGAIVLAMVLIPPKVMSALVVFYLLFIVLLERLAVVAEGYIAGRFMARSPLLSAIGIVTVIVVAQWIAIQMGGLPRDLRLNLSLAIYTAMVGYFIYMGKTFVERHPKIPLRFNPAIGFGIAILMLGSQVAMARMTLPTFAGIDVFDLALIFGLILGFLSGRKD